MPFTRVYLHFVWATKNRSPFLRTPDIRDQLWDHILLNAKYKNIDVLAVGGYQDHCHCLITLQTDQTLSKIAGLLKGESSHWINKSGLLNNLETKKKFEWQDDYFVESVSPSKLQVIKRYIQRQEEHHKVKSLEEELLKFFTELNIQDPQY